MTTSTPDDPGQQQPQGQQPPAEPPEQGEVEHIDEREEKPPRELADPQFDDEGDGAEDKPE